MKALKFNRFSFLEIEGLTIRCKRCGAGHIVKIEGEHFSANRCPSCGVPYGELAQNVFYRLQESYKAMLAAKDYIDVEFDVIEQ